MKSSHLYESIHEKSCPIVEPPRSDLADPLRDARWIWMSATPKRTMPARAWFRHEFQHSGSDRTMLRLTADSRYRLYVNGQWAGDGPVRWWPGHWYYDERDITGLLVEGKNEIRVLVQYYGCGTFHIIPQQPGFCAVLMRDGKTVSATGRSWQVADAPEWQDAPEIAIQMPPGEIFDARLAGEPPWQSPVELASVPWSGFRHRDVRETVIVPRQVGKALEVRRVELPVTARCVPLERLLHPDTVLEAFHKSRACALATEIEVSEAGTFNWVRGDFVLFIDGVRMESDTWDALPGTHRVMAMFPLVHSNQYAAVFGPPSDSRLRYRKPWMLLVDEAFHYCSDDIFWIVDPPKDLAERAEVWTAQIAVWGAASGNEESFCKLCATHGRQVKETELLLPCPDAEFKRRVLGEPVTVAQPQDGPVEWHFDLGDQLAGFHEIEISAPAGTVVDVSLIEFVRPDGVRQHTDQNWAGFRYIAREGRQRFTTRQRRSGRHLFLTVSRASGPVTLHGVRVLETVFPVSCPVPFRCSDDVLTATWKAAARTMELSMDDVYIDSLYEQTLWVGDARNQQLYGLAAWDARDISVRSMRLAADSLERLPMVGSQVPSCWDTIIPIWSFLWGVSVWDYYVYSGEKEIVCEFWPAILKNLRGAAAMLNEDALFDAPWWNLFEWADSDFRHRVVLYNSMFFAAAVRAAIDCGEALGETVDLPWLRTLEVRLKHAVRRKFDAGRGLFPESIRKDGTPTEKFSIHPQFLAVLCGIVTEPSEVKALLDKVTGNQGELVTMASPFAFQFYANAFEVGGREDHVMEKMREFYRPMVETGTTLWEALPGSLTSPKGFPTRSHCHGWSSAPMDLLPRIVLGVRQVKPGTGEFVCSPQPHGLTWAEGCRQTPWGAIEVKWKIEGKVCRVALSHPQEVTVTLQSNRWLEEMGLVLKGV